MRRRFWILLLFGVTLVGFSGCISRPRITLYDLGVAAQDRGDIGPAMEYYKEILMEHPDHLRARFNLAVLYHDQKNYAAAEKHYRRLLERYPDHARSLINLADIMLTTGNPIQAHLLLLRAVEAEPDRAYPYSFLGRYLQQQGNTEQAFIAYQRALALEDDALTRYRLGTLWLQEGNKAEAEKQFAHAIELDPNYGDALYQLALLALETAKNTEALPYLKRLTHLTPYRAEVFILLGKVYMQQGLYATAALHLWEARDLEPQTPDVERLLLQTYQRLLQQQQEVVKRLPPAPPHPVAGVIPKKTQVHR
jgi:protein O-GlcNAc transferase